MSLADSTDDADGLMLADGCNGTCREDGKNNKDDGEYDHDQLSIDLSALLPPASALRPAARAIAAATSRRERAIRHLSPSSGDKNSTPMRSHLYHAQPPTTGTQQGVVALASNCAPAADVAAATTEGIVKGVSLRGDGGVGGGSPTSSLLRPTPLSLAAVVVRQPSQRNSSARRSWCLASRIGAGSSYGTRFSHAGRIPPTRWGAQDADESGGASRLAISEVAGTAKALHLRMAATGRASERTSLLLKAALADVNVPRPSNGTFG